MNGITHHLYCIFFYYTPLFLFRKEKMLPSRGASSLRKEEKKIISSFYDE